MGNTPTTAYPLKPSELSWDFGTLKSGEVVSHTFKLTNYSATTKRIKKVRATCGCTVTNISTMEVAPGKAAEILVTFSSRGMKEGISTTKYIYVEFDEPETLPLKLSISANIGSSKE